MSQNTRFGSSLLQRHHHTGMESYVLSKRSPGGAQAMMKPRSAMVNGDGLAKAIHVNLHQPQWYSPVETPYIIKLAMLIGKTRGEIYCLCTARLIRWSVVVVVSDRHQIRRPFVQPRAQKLAEWRLRWCMPSIHSMRRPSCEYFACSGRIITGILSIVSIVWPSPSPFVH
jgi:hypothetical protein